MAHKVGEIIARGDRRWLIRIYLGQRPRDQKAHISQWNDPWPYTEVQAYLTSRLRERDLGCHESGPTIHMQAAARSNALWSDRLFFN